LNIKGVILFDIDGVIRDVSNSYRLAVQKAVYKYCGFEPSSFDIDVLKNEGIWNNDWDLTLELINRFSKDHQLSISVPTKKDIINIFKNLYFGCDPQKEYKYWTGFIRNEKILVDDGLFEELTNNKIGWGFVSGAEQESVKFVLEQRLNLRNVPIIAMGDAPDKPNPEGFLHLANQLLNCDFNETSPPAAYIGDTIADVNTVLNARKKFPKQKFISIAVVPPHLQKTSNYKKRISYESRLREAGADFILQNINEIKHIYHDLFLI